jgi:hypothetical protein
MIKRASKTYSEIGGMRVKQADGVMRFLLHVLQYSAYREIERIFLALFSQSSADRPIFLNDK